MESIVKDLLEELYIIEPTLKKQEKHLTEIVSLMIQNIPKSEMNTEFKKELRNQILSKIHSKKEAKFSLFFPVFASISVFVLLWIVSWNYFQNSANQHNLGNIISFVPHIEKTRSNAFGHLNSIQTSNDENYNEWGRLSWVAPIAKMNTTMAMPPYEQVTYNYAYSGTLPNIDLSKLIVYKKNPISFTNQDTSTILKWLQMNWLDTGAFQNAGISNMNISEDREFGYNIGIDFVAWNINFSQNYSKWPQSKCGINGCEGLLKITKIDIPSNESLIKITDTFLVKYWINRSIYWIPRIISESGPMTMQWANTDEWWVIPEAITVTYPIALDSKDLYEEYGWFKWITLTVDIRTLRVNNVMGLEKYNLESSEYSRVSDQELNQMIRSWWRHIVWINENKWKNIVINLKDPIIGYVRISWDWKDGVSNDFFVPAYVFSVENKPKDAYIPDPIIIPIVEWFSDSGSIVPSIMPANEPIMIDN